MEGSGYFLSIMSSPSDDGQCTDSDKEEVEDLSATANLSQSQDIKITIGVDQTTEIIRKKIDGSDSLKHSDQEDEEVRLRRKLLERRNATNPAMELTQKNSRSAAGISETNLTNQYAMNLNRSVKEVYSLKPASSEDEEMFSMPPKDSLKKRKLQSHKFNSNKERMKKVERKRKGDHERSKEDRYRRKERERKHEKYRHDRSRDKRRNNNGREERSKHTSSKHRSSPAYREKEYAKQSRGTSSAEKSKTNEHSHEKEKEKDVEKYGADFRSNTKEEKKAPQSQKRTSPFTREIIDKTDVPMKKPRIDHPEEIDKNESDSASPSKIIEKKKKLEKATTLAKTVSDEEVEESELERGLVETDGSSTESEKGVVVNFPKYSKFDSSPETSIEASNSDNESHLSDEANFSEPERSATPSDDEEIDEDVLLDSDDLKELSPETRSRVIKIQNDLLSNFLPIYYPGVNGCRNVAEFECLNRIEEGTFGVVYRACDKRTEEVVALKRLKMEKEKEGFPITSLREINMLIKAGQHENIVGVREIVVGSNMDKIYLVMEYMEHDMKSLMDTMHSRHKNFTIGQVKTLLLQLLRGVAHLHDQWILHRDLKTSNLLLSHKGILKIGDFGLAREFGDPLKPYTPIVVTLWYRSPELILGIEKYSTSIDMWSCGCIFAEFLKLKPLFPGKGELDQLSKIFTELGVPNERIWPDFHKMPGTCKLKLQGSEFNTLARRFPENVLDKTGLEFLNELLRYDPAKRISAREAVHHHWFKQNPLPTPSELFPTWPAKSELCRTVTSAKSPITKPPAASRDTQADKLYKELKVSSPRKEGFSLKFDSVKFGNY